MDTLKMDSLTLTPTSLITPWGNADDSAKPVARAGNRTANPSLTAPATEKLTVSVRDLDQELVLRCQAGDKKAFELLVVKYHRKIGRLLSRMIRDQSEIEDVTQEAFIKAYRALPSFRGESAFYTWLYRIAINTAKNHLSTLGRRPMLSTEYEGEDGETLDTASLVPDMNTPETALMNKQIVDTVNSAVEALPDDLRTAITLREMEGMSYEDIATLMSCPIGTVRSRIFRAREAIATRLRPMIDAKGRDKRW
jgi:RNA polymerase sigma-70 factor, ECF subfamily